MQSPPEFVADAFDAAGRKWQGARAYQEDNFEIVSRNGSDGGEWIGVLCDGMGGMPPVIEQAGSRWMQR